MTMEHHTDWVNDMVICKDGSTLMSGSCDTSLKVWDLSRGICTSTLKPHKDYVQALAYSPQTEIVVSAGLDHELYLWDINTLRNLSSTKNTVSTIPLRGQKQSIYAVDINTQGSLIVSGSTEKVS
jgi:WD repeat-containing protein 48